ncbi:carbohydrate-binding module family 21 protein [Atractiella rhizophila]|nr:carbohydrate-binding module family 21 protein [Atractiella rhizophila]
MPYALPSPSTSPTATMTYPSSPPSRPPIPSFHPPTAGESSTQISASALTESTASTNGETSNAASAEPLSLSSNSLKLDLRRSGVRHHVRSRSDERGSGLIYIRASTPKEEEKQESAEQPEPARSESRDARRIRLYGHKLKFREDEESAKPKDEKADSVGSEDNGRPTSAENIIPFPKTDSSSPFDERKSKMVDESNTVSFPSTGDKSPGLRLDLGTVDLSVFPRVSSPMIRKKSGELVKPSLKSSYGRTKSAPSTPGSSKAVHFDTQLEHVKLFLSQQKPAAVSREGSPIETETEDDGDGFPFGSASHWTISRRLTNFPPMTEQRINSDVYLESLDIAPDNKSLRGIVMVKNLDFSKWICARFSFDNWQTVSEVSADYIDSIRGGLYDKFGFNIKLNDIISKIEEKKLFLCIRYTVGGVELWDSNSGGNYQVEFTRKRKSTAPVKGASSRNTWSVLSEAAAEKRAADIRRELDRLADDDSDAGAAPIPWKTAKSSGNTLATRYDFGTSLKNPRPSSSILDNPYFAPTEPSPRPSRPPPPSNQASFNRYVERPQGPAGKHMEFKDGMPASCYSQAMPAQSSFSHSPGMTELAGYFDGPNSPQYFNPYSSYFYGGVQRPPSPPQDLYSSYSNLLKEEEMSRARFNSYPPTATMSAPIPQYMPLPPLFRHPDLAPASPAPSPPSGSPPQKRSPPLSPSIRSSLEADVPQRMMENGSPLHHIAMLGSTGSSLENSPLSAMTNSSLASSPDTPIVTPPTPLAERPSMDSSSYYDFVDKYCFYQQDPSHQLNLQGTKYSPPPQHNQLYGTPPSSGEVTPMNDSPVVGKGMHLVGLPATAPVPSSGTIAGSTTSAITN